MKELTLLYNTPLKSIKFIDRKLTISSPKTLLVGSSGGGKTFIVIDYLKQFKNDEILYINLEDLRLGKDEILSSLNAFLNVNSQIKHIAIEGVGSETEALKISEILSSNLQSIIITTELESINLQGFKKIILKHLDYEEFIAFFPKNLDQDQIFSHFVNHGNSPNSAFLDQGEVAESLQNKLKLKLNDTSLALMKECVEFQGLTLSSHELYQSLKSRLKISKDSVYNGIFSLQNRGLISLVSKFEQPNAAKKLYLGDFAMRNALSFKKDFTRLFANMVFCELWKFKEEIFYTKDFDFFLYKRKLAILCIPFGDSDLIFLKFKKLHENLKELHINRLQIISVANQAELSIDGIKCEILPFSRWALGID